MRFLITGATGFVGANLVRKILADNLGQVYITARKTANFWRLEEILPQVKRICFLDLADREAVFDLVKTVQPDLIYHLASYGGFWQQSEPDLILKANFQATVNLLDAAVAHQVPQLINTGSSSEYGFKTEPMREDDLCQPLSLYGITKLAATNYGAMIGKTKDYRTCTLRLFSPYGPLEDAMRLYPSIVNALQKGEAPRLSSPDCVRDFIPVEQVIEVYLKIPACQYQPGEVVNLGSGKQQTIKEFYQMIAFEMGSKIEPVWGAVAPRKLEPKFWQADITKLTSLMASIQE